DLINAFWEFYQQPKTAEVYNIGGSRYSNISMKEAISFIQEYNGREMDISVSNDARQGDHIWYVSDVSKFQSHYPSWQYEYTIERTMEEMIEATKSRHR
ncbi:MAG: NAD-dependent epimerase, partial [Bacteroidota bacterium]